MTPHALQPRPREGTERARRVAVWWAVAIMVHLTGAAGYLLWPTADPSAKCPLTAAPKSVSLAEHRDALEASRKARAKWAQAKPKVRAEQRKPKTQPLRGQVVEVAHAAQDRAPDNAAYLAEHNASTPHETRSRHIFQHETNITHEPSAQAIAAQPPAAPAAPAVDRKSAPTPPQSQELAPSEALSATGRQKSVAAQNAHDKLALPQGNAPSAPRNRAPTQTRRGQLDRAAEPSAMTGGPRAGVSPQKSLTMADLIPSLGTLARMGGSPSNDALQDVDEGEGTFLNAREFKYASYFMRIKRGVAERWRAADEYQRRDPTGNIYGYRTRTTDVHVTLDQYGGLKAVTLAASSGVDFLDREGIHAFEAAAPFPNPPKALLNAADEIRFQFSFVFSIGRQSFFAAPY